MSSSIFIVSRDGSRISGIGVHMYKVVRVSFADFISFFLNIPWKWNNLVLLRPNYFIFIGYLKARGKEGSSREPPLDPPLVSICMGNSIRIQGGNFNYLASSLLALKAAVSWNKVPLLWKNFSYFSVPWLG